MNTESQTGPDFRAGTIAVLGRPNVGKSTLVNALVGAKISIVSPRPQTTRHRLLGIATFPEGQLLLVDTPGIHGQQKRAMNRMMNRAARGAIEGVDAAMLVIEAGRWTEDDALAYKALHDSGVPCVLVINKVDKVPEKGKLLPFIAEVTAGRDFSAVYPLSALKKKGLEGLVKTLIERLPVAEAQYAEDEITDRSERFLAGELVREQLMLRLGEELPYSTTVEIEKFELDGEMLRIGAVVWVEREGQKPIVIGKGGERLKAISTGARVGMEKLFDRKVFLETWCKVREGWSDDEAALRRFGYSDRSMRVEGQPAYVLHARPWRETSLIVELLSRDHGRIAVVARGVQGAKRHPLRAALQPLQHLRLDFLPRGELGRLVQAEALDAAPLLQGETLMAAFYLNELLLRLLPRQDPAPLLYERYGEVRAELAGPGPLAWTLRRFERDLLEGLGYGLPLDQTDDGERLDPAARYRLDPELGPVRDRSHDAASTSGAALLALAEDRLPPPGQLAELRNALRGVLSSHLGPQRLKSWGLLSELARIRRDEPGSGSG